MTKVPSPSANETIDLILYFETSRLDSQSVQEINIIALQGL
jgi:hypothetical protein